LIFAIIFKSSPPLLIMDEIDAALDEANSRKFSEILRELSQKSQFIIITHNRTTMEAADYIYGVTFSETGTSQLLSLKFEEATHYVSVK
jgi:chromosome segregation protein